MDGAKLCRTVWGVTHPCFTIIVKSSKLGNNINRIIHRNKMFIMYCELLNGIRSVQYGNLY